MDIHTPTAPTSANTEIVNGNATPTTREELLELMDQKDLLEGELKTLGALLDAHNVTMQTPLTTFDGYPRDDIDVAQIRTARSRIIHLRNDYKHLMSRIEKGLHAFHSSQAVSTSSPSTTATSPMHPHQPSGPPETPTTPFAEVNIVMSGSPAYIAGLKVGDKIKKFGNVHLLNHDRLSKIVEEVESNEGREVKVLVERHGGVEGVGDVELILTPRRGWGGRGLLGCHLMPL